MDRFISKGQSIMILRQQINIQEIEEIQQAASLITDIDAHTLVLMDVTSSLMTPVDPYLRPETLEHFAFIAKSRTQNLSLYDLELFNHLMVMESASRLVECGVHSFLKFLDDHQALVLAYTGMKFGKIGHTFFPDYLFNELNHLGIRLTNAPMHRNITNTTSHFGYQAGIDKGIIYTGSGQTKGDYLDEILDVVGFIPKKIVLIDRDEDNLKAFGKAVNRHYNIPILGIRYKRPHATNQSHLDKEIFNKKVNKILSKIHAISAYNPPIERPHHALHTYAN
ncbi:MAG: DUF2608 domain-containing protein [Alphaproteobacteria bacterium]|nr:DUF2608 domain-containing protein [Alphaproteobacteria bacterium]